MSAISEFGDFCAESRKQIALKIKSDHLLHGKVLTEQQLSDMVERQMKALQFRLYEFQKAFLTQMIIENINNPRPIIEVEENNENKENQSA